MIRNHFYSGYSWKKTAASPRCDDVILFARDQEEAQAYKTIFLESLKKKRLHTNSEKTQIIEPGGKVDMLGCCLDNGIMDIAEHSKKKLKRKIRIMAGHLIREKRTA